MASWLHYPLHDTNFDNDFCADLLYPSSSAACLTSTDTSAAPATPAAPFYPSNPIQNTPAAARPPIPPSRRAEVVQNFSHFSRHKARASELRGKETTVVDSSDTPAGASHSEATMGKSGLGNCSSDNTRTITAPVTVATNNTNTSTCEMTVTSSPGGSSATAELLKTPLEDRKRKGREEEVECHSEDADFELAETKKSGRGSTSTKRSRAAEVHNLSERRRRDRINEKMKALQELIPRCNKSDKASMLDEAIEYLKSLQLQVQVSNVLISDAAASDVLQPEMMMSMGCGMVPIMFPGVQQFMPPMGMGMNHPMMSFPNVFAGPSLPSPAAAAAAAHLGPRFPMPAYQMPPVPSRDPCRIQVSSQTDPMTTTMAPHDPNQARVPNYADPYQQYMSLHHMQIPMLQNQAIAPPSSSRPSTGEGPDSTQGHDR